PDKSGVFGEKFFDELQEIILAVNGFSGWREERARLTKVTCCNCATRSLARIRPGAWTGRCGQACGIPKQIHRSFDLLIRFAHSGLKALSYQSHSVPARGAQDDKLRNNNVMQA